jgi:4'-phosphopantetheinyl transferase
MTGASSAWGPAPTGVELLAEEVHVWRVSLEGSGASDEPRLAVLSTAERDRATRFRFEADRARFVRSHAALRTILAAYMAAAPSELVFGEGRHGKPFLESPTGALRFSLSHSGDLALVAVAGGREVGVDLERVRPVSDMAGIAARFFSPAEQQALEQVAPADRLRAFFATWVLKEAYLKGCGDGLLRQLSAFDVTIGGDEPARLLAARDRPGDEARWTLRCLDPGASYVAALAAEGAGWRLRRWHGGGSFPNTAL